MQPIEDDDDEIVAEIDVYLSKALKDDLAIFQYPLRPAWRENSEMEEVKMKPNHYKFEIEFDINTDSPFCDVDNLTVEQVW